jgi:hypothetical protein
MTNQCNQCGGEMTHNITIESQRVGVCLYPECANFGLLQINSEELAKHTQTDCEYCEQKMQDLLSKK